MKTINVISKLANMGISLNENNEVLLSKDILELLFKQQGGSPEVIFESKELPSSCFVLVDKKSNEFFPFFIRRIG